MIDNRKAVEVFPARQPTKTVRSSPEREADEMLEEIQELDWQGRLDDDAVARFDARVDADLKRREAKLAAGLAEIESRFPSRPAVSFQVWLLAILMLGALIGVFLETTIGSGFIFAESNAYRRAMPWLWGVLLPAFGVAWYLAERRRNALSYRYPTAWVRWLLVFPSAVAASAGTLVVAPLGWAALGGQLAGAAPERMVAKVLTIAPVVPRRRSCDQYARLEVEGATADICLEGRLGGRVPGQGKMVEVVGRRSAFGVLIEAVGAPQ